MIYEVFVLKLCIETIRRTNIARNKLPATIPSLHLALWRMHPRQKTTQYTVPIGFVTNTDFKIVLQRNTAQYVMRVNRVQ